VDLVLPAALPVTSDAENYWYIENPSWGDVEFLGAKAVGAGFELRRISEISFISKAPQDIPLHVTLSLRRHKSTVAAKDSRAGGDPVSFDHLPSDPAWFEVDVELASSARR